MADCSECRYWASFSEECILGRDPELCAGPTVRRGDDELIDRIMGLEEDELDEARRRLGEEEDDVDES